MGSFPEGGHVFGLAMKIVVRKRMVLAIEIPQGGDHSKYTSTYFKVMEV